MATISLGFKIGRKTNVKITEKIIAFLDLVKIERTFFMDVELLRNAQEEILYKVFGHHGPAVLNDLQILDRTGKLKEGSKLITKIFSIDAHGIGARIERTFNRDNVSRYLRFISSIVYNDLTELEMCPPFFDGNILEIPIVNWDAKSHLYMSDLEKYLEKDLYIPLLFDINENTLKTIKNIFEICKNKKVNFLSFIGLALRLGIDNGWRFKKSD